MKSKELDSDQIFDEENDPVEINCELRFDALTYSLIQKIAGVEGKDVDEAIVDLIGIGLETREDLDRLESDRSRGDEYPQIRMCDVCGGRLAVHYVGSMICDSCYKGRKRLP